MTFCSSRDAAWSRILLLLDKSNLSGVAVTVSSEGVAADNQGVAKAVVAELLETAWPTTAFGNISVHGTKQRLWRSSRPLGRCSSSNGKWHRLLRLLQIVLFRKPIAQEQVRSMVDKRESSAHTGKRCSSGNIHFPESRDCSQRSSRPPVVLVTEYSTTRNAAENSDPRERLAAEKRVVTGAAVPDTRVGRSYCGCWRHPTHQEGSIAEE